MITTGGGRSSSARARWSDLPDDILGTIRLKIASLRDRVRITAVCRSWRATAARLPAPPAAPLLMSPRCQTGGRKHLCSGGLDDSWVLRFPRKVAGKYLLGSHQGCWIATFDFGARELVLVNLFSGAEVGVWPADPWGDQWSNLFRNVIFLGDPASSKGCILATITNNFNNIGLCNVGCRSGWTKHGWENKMFMNIAFCNGDLYGLMYPGEELIRFKIGMEEDGSPMVTSIHQLAIQRHHDPRVAYNCYMLELHGKPLKAKRGRWLPNREPFFKVFELHDADVGHKWVEMSSFGEYALFLGPASCKAVHVPVGAERRGFERNHIYYFAVTNSKVNNLCGDGVYSLRFDDGRLIYCKEDQNIGDGLRRTGYYTMGWENMPMWLHPPDL
ncbi:unnamed protein product [Alopecurus aequalis]